MLRATESSLAPDITGTVISTGSLPSVAVMRNARSPLEAALPEVAIFQTPADGGAEAACSERRHEGGESEKAGGAFHDCLRAGAPAAYSGAHCWGGRGGLFALDLDVHVADVGLDQLDREVRLAILSS